MLQQVVEIVNIGILNFKPINFLFCRFEFFTESCF